MSDKRNDELDSIVESEMTVESQTESPIGSDEAGEALSKDEQTIVEEIELEKKYGDSAFRTAMERAAGSASFGISDQVLKNVVDGGDEALRERAKRNKKSALAGEIAGVLGPALVSGGGSLLAKGAIKGIGRKSFLPTVLKQSDKLSPLVLGASKSGQVVEQVTSKVLKKYLKDTGNKKIAQEVLRKGIAKGAGSSVEASLYGVGKLISEDALGNDEFNAENVLAYGGQAALWGGAIGGFFGIAPTVGKAATLMVPVVKNNKVVNYITKPIKNFQNRYLNPEYSALKLLGMKDPVKINEIMTTKAKVVNNVPKIMKNSWKGKPSSFASDKAFRESVENQLGVSGKAIGKSLKEADEMIEAGIISPNVIPTKATMASKQQQKIALLKKDPRNAKHIDEINKELRKLDKALLDETPFTMKNLNSLKQKLKKGEQWSSTFPDEIPIKVQIQRQKAKALRESLTDFADQIDPTIGANLKEALLDYGTTKFMLKRLSKKKLHDPQPFWEHTRDIWLASVIADVIGGAPATALYAMRALNKMDMGNKFLVLTKIEKANNKVVKNISDALNTFLDVGKAKFAPISAKLLIDSPLSGDGHPYKNVKPKDDEQAISQIRANFKQLKENPEWINYISANPIMNDGAPNTYTHSKKVLDNALGFLESKLPHEVSVNPLLKKEPKLSDQQIYKFKRYVNAVQNPLSILDDLKQGALSRESVEAIKFVYPNLYHRIVQGVMEKIEKKPEDVSYEQRLILGTLLDAPTDLALQPAALSKFQSYYKEAQESQAGGAVAPKKGLSAAAAKQLDFAQSEATELEKVSNRRDLNR